METVLLQAPDGRPRGAGELAIGPIGPVIGDAFFALTGVWLRQLSMTPERVKSTLSGQVKGMKDELKSLRSFKACPD